MIPMFTLNHSSAILLAMTIGFLVGAGLMAMWFKRPRRALQYTPWESEPGEEVDLNEIFKYRNQLLRVTIIAPNHQNPETERVVVVPVEAEDLGCTWRYKSAGKPFSILRQTLENYGEWIDTVDMVGLSIIEAAA